MFEKCQQVRAKSATHHLPTPKVHVYPLSGLLYCGYCNTKMRAQNMNGYRYYRDRARELGYDCNQPGLVADEIEMQVVNLVREMKPPSDWKQRAVEAIGQLLGDQKIKEARRRSRR